MSRNLANEIGKLSVAERILLVEEIWDSIARENEAFELTETQKKELERRSQTFASSRAHSWEQLKAEFLKS